MATAAENSSDYANWTNTNGTNRTTGTTKPLRFHLFVFDFERVGSLFSVGVFMLIVAISRMLFHLHSKLPSYVPESCLLIVLGVIAGFIVYFVGGKPIHLDPDTFFLLLLPPIVLDAGFFMNTRALFDNMGTVALFAGVGTTFNTLAIGFSLHLCCQRMLGLVHVDINLLEALLFASLIAAVDPVAVLALFEEIHVNEELYIIVFGESLFNDAVSVVRCACFFFKTN